MKAFLPLVIAPLAFSAAAAAANAENLEFHVIGIECEKCAAPIQKALARTPGVEKARVDWKRETAQVEVEPGFDFKYPHATRMSNSVDVRRSVSFVVAFGFFASRGGFIGERANS